MSLHKPLINPLPGSVVKKTYGAAGCPGTWNGFGHPVIRYTGRSGTLSCESPLAISGSDSATGSWPVPISSAKGREWLPTFGASWQVVQVPANGAMGTVVPSALASAALSVKPRTFEMVSARVLNSFSPAAIFRRMGSGEVSQSAKIVKAVELNALPSGSAPSESLVPG